ncbi:Spo0E family sporulation regulatory protein-aspartic acid phosphatase [Bacillus toyonensis]|nr:Spo0E family sporulation regulatory protein-aspartic acid phosphatase [Bacillus toyonensis]
MIFLFETGVNSMDTSSAYLLPLHEQIADQKKKLHQLVQIHGYTHPLVLARSQELDRLAVHLMRYLFSS